MRAVVLLEAHHGRHLELALEVGHVADVGAAEGVDRLVVVADAEIPGAAAREELQPAVLQAVGVLELVDQDVLETLAVVAAQDLVAPEQLIAAEQELREVHHSLSL